jgi:tetratricopeptide (TPR) repeat protein
MLSPDENLALAGRLCKQAAQSYAQADYGAARSLYEQALALYESVSGSVQLEIARCLNGLGMTLKEQADYEMAQSVLEKALRIREQILGVSHPDVAETMQVLGEMTFDRVDFRTGQELIEQALAIRERVLGAEHADTIESLKSLALVLAYHGHRAQAQALLERAFSACEQGLGENHPITAKVFNALGVFWGADKDNRARARPMYERALAINEQVKGPNHPDTAQSLNNLAALLVDMGEKEAARQLLERSLALHETVFGPKHPRLAFVLTNLADLYDSEHDYSAARPLFERSLIICEEALGARHPMTVKSLRKVVAVLGNLHQQGDEKALLMGMPLHTCLMALEAAAGTLSPDNQHMPGTHLNPDQAAEQLQQLVAKLEADGTRPRLADADQADLQRARDLRRQAEVLHGQGDYPAAESSLKQALAIQERVLGENHLDHVEVLKELARVKKAQGHYSAVLPLIQRVADIHVQELGLSHPTTLLALSDLMSLTSYEYGLAAALPIQELILKAQVEALGPDDRNVRMMRDSLDRLKASMAKTESDEDRTRHSRSEKREDALATLPPERQALLAGIEAINWHDLQHAYGRADDVPDLLHLLLSDDETVRDDAWEHLYSNVWHQGTVYEASAYVVPFMLRMLMYDGPPGKADLLHFLTALAEGSSYLAAHAQAQDDQLSWRGILARQGRDFDAELQKELGWVEATNQAVGEGISLYFDLIDHEEAEIQHLSLALLSSLRGRNAEIVPRLQALLNTTRDLEMRTNVVHTLHNLMDDGLEAQDFFANLVQGGEGEKLIFFAAVALTERAHERTPQSAVTILLNVLQELGRVRHHRDISDEENATGQAIAARFDPPWGSGGLRFAVGALTCLGQVRGVTALLKALPMIQDGEEAREIASILLDMVFNNGQVQAKCTALSRHGPEKRTKVDYWKPEAQPQREASSLTTIQRSVLAAVVAYDPVWRDEHNLLKLYGLPESRDGLRQFIAGSKASPA